MCRPSIIIVLMLSLLVPLQTTADTLAAALMCAHEQQAAIPPTVTPELDSDHSSMKCCPQAQLEEKNQQQTTSDCQQMKCCQWCYANRITLTSITPVLIYTNAAPMISSERFSLLSINPASVWRPPTAS